MKNIIKTFSLLSIFAVIPGAMAATSRVSMISKASPRLPSIAGYILANTGKTTTGTVVNTSSTTYLADVDCIDNYTSCIKGDDVCGSDFQECTTNVLFHGQMSKCLSVLYQCNPSGVNALFGTSAINALSNVASYETIDGVQEVSRYTYPTDGSVLGQLIVGAGITNKLNTEQCVRRYTNCLKRDDICGEDFELCTDATSFKKQALLCNSTLARCQNEGKIQLFGAVANATSLNPKGDSRLGVLIEEGASLAALNAVKTCNKVVDNCLVNSCVKNPFRCVEGVSLETIDTADIIAGANDDKFNLAAIKNADGTELTTASDVRKLIKTQCLETIGANKYCHMTYLEKMPSKRDLGDPELQEEVFSLAYSARKEYANTKIQEEIKKFDSDAKSKCIDTISSCVMRSCGGGIGSVCYKRAKSDSKIGEVNVNSANTYNDIKAGCSAIVNADANCIYAATAGGTDGYQYSFTNKDTFTTLFPEHTGSEDDQIGAVATLNSVLATSYNDAAIESMKKQCQTVALGCVKSMCGKDYEYCYRNRTDIVAGTYDTGNAKLNRSMNKMGGVLDYNIVIGLCMDTVKNASICEEHLKVAAADWRDESYKDSNSWGTGSVRAGWLGANTTKINQNADDVLIACAISSQEAQSKSGCTAYDRAEPNANGTCDGVMDEDGCVYSEPVYQSNAEYVLENAGKTLFQELLADVEKEAQAKYNAKLTKEQNVCLAQNEGGIMGASDNGSTFMWVKLKGNKIPKNYNMAGLKTKEFTASNDLYGSFCRARITVTSDDKTIQDALGDKATAYFAVGDSFTCGSWIDQGTLDSITKKVGEKARKDAGEGSSKAKIAAAWGTVAPALVGGGLSVFGVSKLQDKGLLGGKNKKKDEKDDKNLDKCADKVIEARNLMNANNAGRGIQNGFNAVDAANEAARYARLGGVEESKIPSFQIQRDEKTVETISGYSFNNDEVSQVNYYINLIKTYGGENCGKNCKASLESIENLLKTTPTQEIDYSGIVKQWLSDAKKECNNQKDEGKCSGVNIPESLSLHSVANKTKADEIKVYTVTFSEDLDSLQEACANAKDTNNKGNDKKARNAKIIGGTLGAVTTGMLGLGITKSVQKAKYDKAENAAVAQWMEEIGEHIQCYLGTEELGSYGDVVSFTIE